MATEKRLIVQQRMTPVVYAGAAAAFSPAKQMEFCKSKGFVAASGYSLTRDQVAFTCVIPVPNSYSNPPAPPN